MSTDALTDGMTWTVDTTPGPVKRLASRPDVFEVWLVGLAGDGRRYVIPLQFRSKLCAQFTADLLTEALKRDIPDGLPKEEH